MDQGLNNPENATKKAQRQAADAIYNTKPSPLLTTSTAISSTFWASAPSSFTAASKPEQYGTLSRRMRAPTEPETEAMSSSTCGLVGCCADDWQESCILHQGLAF